ncbi:MAG: hypothetical protein AAF456_02500 [Planctomycetota bacterium]
MNHRIFCFAAILVSGLYTVCPGDLVSLSGAGHNGYLSLSGVNTEGVEPESGQPGSKNLDMPFYFDPSRGASGLWVYLVGTPLSSQSVYAEESDPSLSGFGGKSVTHSMFGHSSFGNIDYDPSAITGVGQETISLFESDFQIDLSSFSPRNEFYGATNPDNEFNWDYVVETLGFSGAAPTMTFDDGKLVSIDGSIDVGLAVRFAGLDAAKFRTGSASGPVATYDGTLTFSGSTFSFDVDETQSVFTLLGEIDNTRLVFNRSGRIAGIPEPGSFILLTGLFVLAAGRRSRS